MVLALFDCDGVLVNTEELAERITREQLSLLGLDFTDQEYNARYSGASDLDFMRLAQEDCKARTGQDAPADLLDRILALYHAQEAQHIQAIAGVRDVLESLQRSHVPFAIVSNGARVDILRKLKLAGLDDLFPEHAIFAREDVAAGRGKPHPDICLVAMQAMGETDPQNCIFTDDSVKGVQAGRAAGMFTIGFSAGAHRHLDYAQSLKQAGADVVCDSMGGAGMEIFSQIDQIVQGPQGRNAGVLQRRRALGGQSPS